VLEPCSNGQIEGQINRLKAIKLAMYGRADSRRYAERVAAIGTPARGHPRMVNSLAAMYLTSTAYYLRIVHQGKLEIRQWPANLINRS